MDKQRATLESDNFLWSYHKHWNRTFSPTNKEDAYKWLESQGYDFERTPNGPVPKIRRPAKRNPDTHPIIGGAA
jgi:hypothetical protein